MQQRLDRIIDGLPTRWLENYVDTYEAGRVQKHPHARFVTERGECCIVAAMAGAVSASTFVGSELWNELLGGELEALSRGFESRRLTGRAVYDEAVLTLAKRAGTASSGAGIALEPASAAI